MLSFVFGEFDSGRAQQCSMFCSRRGARLLDRVLFEVRSATLTAVLVASPSSVFHLEVLVISIFTLRSVLNACADDPAEYALALYRAFFWIGKCTGLGARPASVLRTAKSIIASPQKRDQTTHSAVQKYRYIYPGGVDRTNQMRQRETDCVLYRPLPSTRLYTSATWYDWNPCWCT